jgi:hypothetical protein
MVKVAAFAEGRSRVSQVQAQDRMAARQMVGRAYKNIPAGFASRKSVNQHDERFPGIADRHIQRRPKIVATRVSQRKDELSRSIWSEIGRAEPDCISRCLKIRAEPWKPRMKRRWRAACAAEKKGVIAHSCLVTGALI